MIDSGVGLVGSLGISLSATIAVYPWEFFGKSGHEKFQLYAHFKHKKKLNRRQLCTV